MTFALIPAGKDGQEGLTNDSMVFTLKGLRLTEETAIWADQESHCDPGHKDGNTFFLCGLLKPKPPACPKETRVDMISKR